jgi:hypothetical protein
MTVPLHLISSHPGTHLTLGIDYRPTSTTILVLAYTTSTNTLYKSTINVTNSLSLRRREDIDTSVLIGKGVLPTVMGCFERAYIIAFVSAGMVSSV